MLNFTFETVLSHPSKLSFLQQARTLGYKNYLYFVCTVDPAINISRVAQRVALKGHDVPENKIVNRYYDSLALLPSLIPQTYRSYLFDNSAENSAISLIAEIENGTTFIPKTEEIPIQTKAALFRSLFRGKEDVLKRLINSKHVKRIYQKIDQDLTAIMPFKNKIVLLLSEIILTIYNKVM